MKSVHPFLLFFAVLISMALPSSALAFQPFWYADQKKESLDHTRTELFGNAILALPGAWEMHAEHITVRWTKEDARAYGEVAILCPRTDVFLSSSHADVSWGRYPLLHAYGNVRFFHGEYEFYAAEANYEPDGRYIDLFGGVHFLLRGWEGGRCDAVRYDLHEARILSKTAAHRADR